MAEFAGKLRDLGFASADVDDALAVAIAQDGRPSLETALDWLCLNVPEDDLPPVFAAGPHCTNPLLFGICSVGCAESICSHNRKWLQLESDRIEVIW